MRLSRARDIRRVFQSGLKISNDYVTIRARRRTVRTPRLGLAVARKHVASAVERNRIKRIVRESFRLNARKLTGLDVVVISRPGISRAENVALRKALDANWIRLWDELRLAEKRAGEEA
ncbi:MAG TPA: ribonuclease P protein component [Gammaproteobacteria bacterium]|nr:ribonuclease P protein component [Gammaproteobacteria bacterium]